MLTVPANKRAKVTARTGASSIFFFIEPISQPLHELLMMKHAVSYLMLFFPYVVLIFEQAQRKAFEDSS